MKDKILEGFLSDFSQKYSLETLGEDDQFEQFVNFNLVSKLYPKDINIDDLSVGGANDTAIDGVAIIVNGSIINDEKDIEFFIKNNGFLDVSFVFIQSKNSPRFKGDAVGNFIFGVKSFFEDEPIIPENDKIKSLRKIKEKIYTHSIDFEHNPEIKLYFVSTGVWTNPETIVSRANYEFEVFKEKNLFLNSKPEEFIEFIDAERLKNIYREISRRSVKEVLFNNHVALPDMTEKVNQSFIGSILLRNFIELIKDSDGNISKGLFFDNVRDYQGKNKVNKEIEITIRNLDKQNLLPLLNNGITIISKKVERTGQKLKLTDFQIVNGCQSSHILFENRKYINETSNIIVKIIETTDQDTINDIIIATNKQTEVKDEAFESLKPFHKDLSEYYKAMGKSTKYPIFYERRSKEYVNDPNVKPYQIITLSSLIRSYVSMILEQPQSTHRYYGEILDSNRDSIFNATHKNMIPNYYLSSLILNRLETMLRNQTIYSRYKIYKYHILFIAYKLLSLEKDNNGRYLNIDDIINKVEDLKYLKSIFIKACKLITDTITDMNLKNDYFISRNKEFTLKLRDNISKGITQQ